MEKLFGSPAFKAKPDEWLMLWRASATTMLKSGRD
jgi:hypothetical protein